MRGTGKIDKQITEKFGKVRRLYDSATIKEMTEKFCGDWQWWLACLFNMNAVSTNFQSRKIKLGRVKKNKGKLI